MSQYSGLAGAGDPLSQSGTLYVCAPEPTVEEKLRGVLDGCGIKFQQLHENVLSVPLARDRLSRLCTAVGGELSDSELVETKCCVVPGSSTPTAAQLMQTKGLQHLIQTHEEHW